MGQLNTKSNAPGQSVVALVIERLAAVKFAVSVVVVIAVACIVGTILPQGAEVDRYLHKNPAAAGQMELFGKLGLTHVFYSWWFVGLLCVLSASIMTCSSRRFATVRRTTGYARWHACGTMITHISILLILAGGVMRGVWGQKGYLEFREGQTVAQFVGDRGVQALPFGIHLAKFEIETYDKREENQNLLVSWPEKNLKTALPVKVDMEQEFGEFTIKVLRYVPDFIVDTATHEIKSRSSQPRNPAILVAVNGPTYQNHRWLFAKFPEFNQAPAASPLQMSYLTRGAGQMPTGPIKSFRSTVQLPNGEHTLEVNRPLSFMGYSFYQSGYNPNDLSYTSLQVIKDPGVPVVYTGFSLLIVGLGIVFYLNPWLNERRKTV